MQFAVCPWLKEGEKERKKRMRRRNERMGNVEAVMDSVSMQVPGHRSYLHQRPVADPAYIRGQATYPAYIRGQATYPAYIRGQATYPAYIRGL